MKKKKILSMLLAGTALCASMLFGGCGTSGSDSASSGNDGKVVIYSNADDEAVDAMKKALDNNGFRRCSTSSTERIPTQRQTLSSVLMRRTRNMSWHSIGMD